MKYSIANIGFEVKDDRLVNVLAGIWGFKKFVAPEETKAEFEWVYREEEPPVTTRVEYEFEAEGVKSVFGETASGHRLTMVDQEKNCLEMWTLKKEARVCFGGVMEVTMLRFAAWMGYGLMTVDKGRIAVHSSCIVNGNRGFLFLGESGTGKSTHTRLWREHVPGSVLLNDDSPIVAAEDSGVWVYGSPWSGKTPCYKTERFRLGGMVRLSQAPVNRMKKLGVLGAYAAVHPSCPPQFAYDEDLYGAIAETLDKVLRVVPCYAMGCLPNGDAARMSYETLCGHED